MRAIKFRQWTGERFHYFGFMDEGFISPMSSKIHKYPVYEYTGLKDSKGREIYEGEWMKDASGVCFLVEWDDEYTGFKPFSWADGWEVDEDLCEVIGNIHETPKLIPK